MAHPVAPRQEPAEEPSREPATYSLTDSLAHLLNRAGARTGDLFGRRLAPFGITVPMHRVLAALLERNDQRLSDLAAMTSIEVSTLSRLVGAMAQRGLISRERMEGDGRTVTISLTEAGGTLARRLIPLAIHHEQVSLQDLSPDVVARLKHQLIAIHDNLDALEDELATAPVAVGSRVGARPGLARIPRVASLPDSP